MSTSDRPPEHRLERIDYDEFRRRIAGLADPDHVKIAESAAGRDEYRTESVRFCCVLAHLFGDELDKLTLWDRISGALAQGVSKVSDDDLERFISLCLEHVCADAGKAAACDALGQILDTWHSRPAEWKQGLLRYVATHSYAVVTHGRARWKLVLKKEVEL